MDEVILTRRELIGSILALPLLEIDFNEKSYETFPVVQLEDREVIMGGITFLAKFWREKRWDIIYRIYSVMSEKLSPDIDFPKLSEIIRKRMEAQGNDIHYITVAPSWHGEYFVHFKYINSDIELCQPIK